MVSQYLESTNQFSVINDQICKGSLGTFFPYNGDNFSQIDHIIVDNDMRHLMRECFVHDDHALNSSDHHPISIVMSTETPRVTPHTRKVFKWDQADLGLYQSSLDDTLNSSGLCDESALQHIDELDGYYDKLVRVIQQVADHKFLPT